MTIKTWRERLFTAEPEWRFYPANSGAVWEVGNHFKEYEIADLRAALEAQTALLEEAAQVFESAAKHNHEQGRTVFAHAQQDRANRIRAVLEKP